MNTYKITNITNTFEKREAKYNTTLEIDYIDNLTKKYVKIRPGDSVYLTVPTLPLSVQRLRIKNLVTVVEITKEELLKHINDTNSKVTGVVANEEIDKKVQQKQKNQQTNKKRIDKKDEIYDTEKDA